MNPELLDMAGGDTYRARALHQLLTKLADGPNPVLREMASGVLKGELSLRDAANNQVYSDAIADRFDTFWQRYQTLDPDERQALLSEGTDSSNNRNHGQTRRRPDRLSPFPLGYIQPLCSITL